VNHHPRHDDPFKPRSFARVVFPDGHETQVKILQVRHNPYRVVTEAGTFRPITRWDVLGVDIADGDFVDARARLRPALSNVIQLWKAA